MDKFVIIDGNSLINRAFYALPQLANSEGVISNAVFGFTTILFTGRLYPEDRQKADIHLFVYRGEENEYHSMSAPAAIVDALVIAFSAQMGARAVEKLDAVQQLKMKFRNKIE